MDHTPEVAGSMELPKEDGIEQRTRDGAHFQAAQDAEFDAEAKAAQQRSPVEKSPLPGNEVTSMDLDKGPPALVPYAPDAVNPVQADAGMSRDKAHDKTGAPLTQELEMLGTVQLPSTVRRIAVRSVLWDDIIVEIPSTATMAEFRKAIETQSGGRLREDMSPELVYDGILLPADETSIEEAGLMVENAVVGFLAMNVSALINSGGLELEPSREKKGRDRRIKIYVPCAPRTFTDAPALEDTTPSNALKAAPVLIPSAPLEPSSLPPSNKPVPSIPAVPPMSSANAPTRTDVPLNPPPSADTGVAQPPTELPAQSQTSGDLPGVDQPPEATAPEATAQPVASHPPSDSPVEAAPSQGLPFPTEDQKDSSQHPDSAGAPESSGQKEEPPSNEAAAALGEIGRSGSDKPAPSDGVGPSVLTPGMVDACSQIEPGELHFPLLVLSALPPHLLQYSMGGDPNPPQETAASEGGHDARAVGPPLSDTPAAKPVVEEAPSGQGGLEVALLPVPYLPPPPIVYGPGGREMVPVDTTRRRKRKAATETEEERQIRLRRARKLFTVGEVEALVTAVERLGPGRWREVKERVFSHADHRTYGDLKDKWKTLVKTAQIAPQQRRGVEIPEELLERVTRAHAFWTAQAAKDERLTDVDGPPHVHYIRVPEPVRRPFFQNGAHPRQHNVHVHRHPATSRGGRKGAGPGPHNGLDMQGRNRGAEAGPSGQAGGGVSRGGYHAQGPQGYPLQQGDVARNQGPSQAAGQQGPSMAPSAHTALPLEQYSEHPPPYADPSAAHHWQQQMHTHYYQQAAYPPQYACEGGPHPEAPYQPEQGFAHHMPPDGQPMHPGEHLTQPGEHHTQSAEHHMQSAEHHMQPAEHHMQPAEQHMHSAGGQHMQPVGMPQQGVYHEGGAEYEDGRSYQQNGEQGAYPRNNEGGYSQEGAAYHQAGEEVYPHEGAGVYQQGGAEGYQEPGGGDFQQGGEGQGQEAYEQGGGEVYQHEGYEQAGDGEYQTDQAEHPQTQQGYAALNEYLVGEQGPGRQFTEGYAQQMVDQMGVTEEGAIGQGAKTEGK